VVITTNHPNGCPLENYPEVMTLLMTKLKRNAEMVMLPEQLLNRTSLGSIECKLDGWRSPL